MRAERDRRAAILTAEGVKQSAILTAEGEKQSQILRAEGSAQARILEAQGQARAIQQVFDAIHRGKPTQKLLAYQYLQVLPQIARGDSNKMWIIPSELTDALQGHRRTPGRHSQAGLAGDDEDAWVDTGDASPTPSTTPPRGPGRGPGRGPWRGGLASAEAEEHARRRPAGAGHRRGCGHPVRPRTGRPAGPAARPAGPAGRAAGAPQAAAGGRPGAGRPERPARS